MDLSLTVVSKDFVRNFLGKLHCRIQKKVLDTVIELIEKLVQLVKY